MKTAGLWMHVWDVWSDGLDAVLGYARDAGLTHLYPACVYHTGWFIHPHSRGRRVWMPEDGVAYFQADADLWAGGRVRPATASICQDVDWLAQLRDAAPDYGLLLSAWAVCCHNTALGRHYSDLTVENCFGDRYPHALNPSHPDVRAYVATLVKNLALRYKLDTVQLESPGYLGFRHGHHHERFSVELDGVAQRLFDLSFAASDLAMVRAAGIDGEALREGVAAKLQAFFDAAPDRPAGWPQSWDEATDQLPGLRQYHRAQSTIVEGLVQGCRQALDGTPTRLEGMTCGAQYCVVTIMCYGHTAEQIIGRIAEARGHMEPRQKLQVGLRVGFGDVRSAAHLAELVAACDEAGADGVLFYNYGEMSRTNLGWLGPALAGCVER